MESDADSLVYPQRFLSTSHPASPSSTHEAFRSFHHLCSYTVSFQDLVCKRGGAKPFRAVFSLRDINDDSPEAEAEAGLGVGLGLHNIDINSGDEQEEKLRINDSIRSNNRISIEGKVYAHKAFSNTYNHYSKGRYGTTIVDQELAFVIYGYVKGIKKDVVMMNVSKVQAGSNASALNPIKGKHVNAYPSYALSTGANYIISFYGSSHYHSRQQHNTLIRYLHTMTDMEALQVMIAPQIRGQLPTTPTHAAIPMVKQEPIEEEPITPRSTRRSHVRSASSPLVFTGTSSAVTSVLASASLASAAVSTSQSVSVSCGLGLSVNVNAPMCSSPISGHHSRSHSYDADSPRAKRSSSKRRYDQPTTTSATTTSTSPSTDDCNMATTPRQHQSQHPINPHNALGSTSPTSAAAPTPTPTSAPSSHPQLRLSHSSSSLPHAMSLLQQQRPLQLGIGNKAVEDALHKRRRRHSKMHPSAPVAANPHIHIPTAAQHHHQQQQHHHHDASTVLNSPASYLSSSFRGLNLNVPTTFSLGSPNASHKSSASPSRTSALTISLASASLAKYINSNEYHETTPHSGSSSMVSSPRESRSGSFSTYHEYSSMASSTNMDNDDVDSVYTEDDTLSSFSTASPSSVDELDQHATSWPEVTTNFTINLKGLDKIAHEPTRSDYQDPILSSLPSVSTSMPPPTSMDTSSSSDYGYGYGYGYAGTAIRTQHSGMDPLAYHNHSSALLFDRYNEEFSC